MAGIEAVSELEETEGELGRPVKWSLGRVSEMGCCWVCAGYACVNGVFDWVLG